MYNPTKFHQIPKG